MYSFHSLWTYILKDTVTQYSSIHNRHLYEVLSYIQHTFFYSKILWLVWEALIHKNSEHIQTLFTIWIVMFKRSCVLYMTNYGLQSELQCSKEVVYYTWPIMVYNLNYNVQKKCCVLYKTNYGLQSEIVMFKRSAVYYTRPIMVYNLKL